MSIQAIDPAACPLCGSANRCAMEIERSTGVPQAACWCATRSFDAGLLSRVPEAARDRACICAACLSAFEPTQTSSQS